MYNASTAFKNAIDNQGRITNVQITYPGSVIISSEDALTSFNYEDSLFSENENTYIGSFVAKKVKFSYYLAYPGLSVTSIDQIVSVAQGLYVSGAYEYIPMGSYKINSETKDIKTDSVSLEAVDLAILFDVKYSSTYVAGMTIYDWALSICNAVGVELGSTTWYNSTQVLAAEPYIEGTFRDAIKHIAGATLTFAKIGRDDKLYFRTFASDATQLSNIFEYTIEDKYGPINQLVFGKGSTNDNVAIKDDASILANGLTEILIDNNEIINYLDREALITAYFTVVSGFEYDIVSINYPGNPCIDVGDIITFLDDNDVVKTIYIFDVKLEQTGSWYGTLKSTAMSKTDTNSDYKGSYDKRISITEINVDKVNQSISLIVKKDDDQDTQLSQIILDINSIESTVISHDNDIGTLQTTVTQTANNLTIEIERVDELNRYYQYSIDGLTIGADDSPAQIFIGFETIGGVDTPYMLLTDGANSTAKIQSNTMTINNIVVGSSIIMGVHKVSQYTLGTDEVTVFQKI